MNAVLVIGVHCEEFAFGLKAAQLIENDIQVVQVTSGLSHEKSLYLSGFYHSIAHREMYLQLHQQLKGKADLVIDLHTGINETGRCADILSADTCLLRTMKTRLETIVQHPFSLPGEERLYQITQLDGQYERNDGPFPACHTIIPQQIWGGHDYIYAGLEIYLHEPGEGSMADCEYGVQLIRMLCLSVENIVKEQED